MGPILLAFAVAANAAAAMILEIAAGRLLAPYFGMSLYSWTTVIGVVLAGLTLGHWLGGYLAAAEGRALTRRLSLSFWAGAATSALVLPVLSLLVGGTGLRDLPPAPAIAISGFAAFFLPSLLAGLVQPMATKAALEMLGADADGRATGRVLGRMLAMGALGSILGTFLAGFLLISYIGSSGTVWLVAGINALLGALFLPPLARLLGLAGSAGALALFLLTPLGGAAFQSPCDEESQYFCIQIDPADGMTGSPSRLMALDHLVHSINDRDDPQLLVSPYLHLVDEIVLRLFPEGPERAFFVGGGGFTLPRAWQDRWPGRPLTVAEIDPAVTAAAEASLWFQAAQDTEVVARDARVALARSAQRYDVIFGDAFKDIAIPAHLVTREFHDLVAAHLTDGGFYALNLVDNPQEPRLLSSMVLTLYQSFETVEVWVAPEDIAGARRATFILFASNRPSGLPNHLRSVQGYERRWAQIELARLPLQEMGVLLTDDFTPVDRLLSELWLEGE